MKARRKSQTSLTFEWGLSPKRAGLARLPEAISFLHRFPPPKVFPPSAFDAWAEREEVMIHGHVYHVPPISRRDDPRWLAHLRDRLVLKAQLNGAGANDRLLAEEGCVPFCILVLAPGKAWEVLPSHKAYKDGRLIKPLSAAAHLVKGRVQALLQSADWRQAPSWALEVAKGFYMDITNMEEDVDTAVERIERKYERMERFIQQAIAEGREPKAIAELALSTQNADTDA